MFDPAMLWIWIALGVAVVLLAVIVPVASGRRAVERANARADGAWQEVEGHVKRRGELAGQVAQALETAAPHERDAVDGLEAANRRALEASGPAALSAAESGFQESLRQALHVAKGYPALQQAPRFLELESELREQDNRIQSSRRFYNGAVRELSTKRRTFPGSLAAGRADEREFFDAADASAIAAPPRIEF